MNLSRAALVAKREYTKVVRKPLFWVSTLALPIFIIVVSLISGITADSAETRLEELVGEAQGILVLDQAGVIVPELIDGPLQTVEDFDQGLAEVTAGNTDALVVYPENVLTDYQIQVYGQDKGLLSSSIYDGLAESLLKRSILTQLEDDSAAALSAGYSVEFVGFENGEEVNTGFERLIVPLVSVIIYFVLIIFSTSYLLMSVSEEKENRMIETVLSILKPSELILGKIIGQIGVVFTQLIVLAGLSALALSMMNLNLPIDLGQLDISIGQIIGAIFYTITGFFIMASIMVGVGAAMPSYKEASSFSSVFMIASIFPLYLSAAIIAEPSGTIAQVFSYIPITAPMVLIFRNALGELSSLEFIISSIILVVFAIGSYWLAFKLFEFGSLQYNSRVSFSTFFKDLKARVFNS